MGERGNEREVMREGGRDFERGRKIEREGEGEREREITANMYHMNDNEKITIERYKIKERYI